MQRLLLLTFKYIMRTLFKEQYQQSALQYSPGPNMGLIGLLRLMLRGDTHTTINPKQLLKKTEKHGSFIIVDIRSKKAFDEGHILNAVNIPLKNLVLADDFPFAKDVEIIVICYLGVTSREAISILAEQGYTNLTNMIGGMGAWEYGKVQTYATR